MCRNIKTLFNFDPPATDEEMRAASLQFVRKLSGFNAPSKANENAFNKAIDDVAKIARRLIDDLDTHRAAEEPGRGSGESKSAGGRTIRHGARVNLMARKPQALDPPSNRSR